MIQINKIKDRKRTIQNPILKKPIIILFEPADEIILTTIFDTLTYIYNLKVTIIHKTTEIFEKIVSHNPNSPTHQVLSFLSSLNQQEEMLTHQEDIILLNGSIFASGIIYQGHLQISHHSIYILQNIAKHFKTASPDLIFFTPIGTEVSNDCYRSFFLNNATAIFDSQFEYIEQENFNYDFSINKIVNLYLQTE
jgi:hypothetical protein